MKKLFCLSVVILIFLFTGVPSVLAGDTYCSGDLGAVTIKGNLIVDESCRCTLNGTTIKGSIIVNGGGRIIAEGVNVSGGLQASGASQIQLLQGSRIGSNVSIDGTTGPEAGIIEDSQIRGSLELIENETEFVIRQNTISGNLRLRENIERVEVRANAVSANLVILNNTGGISIIENQIKGGLTCKDNDPAPRGNDNIVSGKIKSQCADMEPAEVSVPNIVGLSQADAEAIVSGAYLNVGVISTAYDSTVPLGHVIRQEPVAGTIVDEGTPVDFVICMQTGVSPVITSSANPDIITEGQSSELSWTTEHAGSVTIDNGIGSVALSGSISVLPSATTDYTITATGPGGTTTETVTVIVTPVPAPIVTFSATPETITAGESATLSWTTENADSVSIDNGVGTVDTTGSLIVTPTQTTTYTITATGPGGTASDQATVTVSSTLLPEVTLDASSTDITAGDSITLSWTSTNADSCEITPGIGAVALNGSLDVTPAETTTYIITATGLGGSANSSVTVTVKTLAISITSPSDNDTIFKSDILIQGTIDNPLGNEVGVNVNGIIAMVNEDQFVANHVFLEEGENTITATATDIDGNTATTSIMINAVTTGDYIRITADAESGVSSLETVLKVDGSFSFTESVLSNTGPGIVEFTSGTNNDVVYSIRMTTPGAYFFTAEATDSQGHNYSDTVAICLLDKTEIDSLLSSKWNGMRNALRVNDIDHAVEFFDSSTKDAYRNAFSALSPAQLIEIANNLDNIQFIKIETNAAEYDLRIIENNEECSYYLLFTKDNNGIWKIRTF